MQQRKYSSLYDVLGVDKSASAAELRRAYKRRVLETHPDKLEPDASEADRQAAEAHFHKVQEAFETLGDAQKRVTYDARLAMNADTMVLSEETARRMADRLDWALRQREQYKKRMERHEAETKRLSQAAMTQQEALVSEMLQELYDMNPGLAERRRAALQRKAERDNATLRSRSLRT